MGDRRDPGERYRSGDRGSDAGDAGRARGRGAGEVEQESVAREGFLARVPAWVVPLGAGFLLTSTLITATLAALSTYLLVTGNYVGALAPFEPFRSRMLLVVLQSTFATLFQGLGTYFARQQTHWGTVLLAAIFGSLVFVTLPFTVPAMVLIGLGRYHFSLTTPVGRIRGE